MHSPRSPSFTYWVCAHARAQHLDFASTLLMLTGDVPLLSVLASRNCVMTIEALVLLLDLELNADLVEPRPGWARAAFVQYADRIIYRVLAAREALGPPPCEYTPDIFYEHETGGPVGVPAERLLAAPPELKAVGRALYVPARARREVPGSFVHPYMRLGIGMLTEGLLATLMSYVADTGFDKYFHRWVAWRAEYMLAHEE